MSAAPLDHSYLARRGAHMLLWLYLAGTAALAIWTLPDVRSPWPTLLAIALLFGLGLVVSLDRHDVLPLPRAVAAAAYPAIATLLVSWQVVQGGYSTWYLGAGTIVLFYLGLRGRVGLSWIGFLGLTAATVLWAVASDLDVISNLLGLARQAAVLLVGTLFAIGLRRTGQTIGKLNRDAAVRSAVQASSLATTTERASRLVSLERLARPLLETIASGAVLSAAERELAALTEAELRDSLRARALYREPLISSAREARRRGVDVVLLDDSGPGGPEAAALDEAVALVVAALADVDSRSVTARLLPPGRDQVATVVVDGAHPSRQDVRRRPQPISDSAATR